MRFSHRGGWCSLFDTLTDTHRNSIACQSATRQCTRGRGTTVPASPITRSSIRIGGELLFNLLTDRYERRATVVTTNLAFAEWVTVFAGDEKLTTALLDRLAHHATVLTTTAKSCRMRKRRSPEGPA